MRRTIIVIAVFAMFSATAISCTKSAEDTNNNPPVTASNGNNNNNTNNNNNPPITANH